jgi:CheY-like chemotaxis protein
MHTILVVDDHGDIRELLTQRLQQRGFAVIAAANGLEAVVAAAGSNPSLILMDVNMPELDGFEATLQIRADASHHRVPIVALTAYSLPGDEARAIAAGCDAFQSKPIDFEKLFTQINALLEQSSKAVQ